MFPWNAKLNRQTWMNGGGSRSRVLNREVRDKGNEVGLYIFGKILNNVVK